MRIHRRGLLALVLVVATVLASGRAWGALVGDHAWFDALGYADIWWWRTSVSLLLKCGIGVVATLAMRAHLEAIRRSFVSVVVPGSVGNLELRGAVPDRTISLVLWAVAFVLGLLLTIPIDDWLPFANVLDARPLSEADPYFQYDLTFWVHWLPFELQLYTWALIAHATMSMLVIVGYVLTRGIGTDGRLLRISRHARRHITVLGAILLLLIAWSYRLDGFDRLINGSSPEGTFSFADHRIGLPGGIIMQVISLAAAAVVVWSAWSRQPRAAVAAVTTVLLMALLLRQGLPLLADSVDGGADPVERERRYHDASDSFTRRAFDADRVLLAAAGDTASLPATPLWDRGSLPHPAPRLGTMISWQPVAGAPGAIVFDALSTPGLLPTWRAITLDLSAVTSVSPPTAATASHVLSLPPIAVSDSGRGYALVSDPAHRIASPPIATFSARLAQAWNQQNPRLLFSAVPRPAPVLVTVRDVRERVALLTPQLLSGSQVTPVVYADSLWWVADLYAASATYPLSEHRLLGDSEVAAAQPALTALINAHTGRLTLMQDGDVPLLARRPLDRLRPHLVSASAVPEGLRRLLPPRADALDLEAGIAARTGSHGIQSDTSARARGVAPLQGFRVRRALLSDSLLVQDDFAPVWMPDRGAYALTATVVDPRDAIRGVLIAPGGLDRRTRWRPASSATPFEGVQVAVRETTDSLRTPGSTAGLRHSGTRVLPGPNGPRYVTPFFAMRDGRATQLRSVLVTDGVRRGVAANVPEAMLAWRDGPESGAGATAAAALFRQMRDALRRGAWGEFGASFDALGRTLGVPARDSSPR